LLPFRTPTYARTQVSLLKSIIDIPTVSAAGRCQRQNPTTTRTRKRLRSAVITCFACGLSKGRRLMLMRLSVSSFSHPTMSKSKHPLVGKPAPALSLPNADGTTFDYKPGTDGKPTAIFFYPAAGTYGCTREVCSFRDALTEKVEFKDSGIHVIGIAPDPVAAVKAFATQYDVTYPMLSDASGEARKAYSVGRGMMGLSEGRVTFFVDSGGIVRDTFDSVINYNGHVKAVSRALEQYRSESKSASTSAGAETHA